MSQRRCGARTNIAPFARPIHFRNGRRSELRPQPRAGDCLTRDEFERRYAAIPALKKAELIEGVVYVESPVSHVRHGLPHSNLAAWLTFYRALTPGVVTSDNATVRLDLDNEPQPDLLLCLPEAFSRRERSRTIFLVRVSARRF